MRQTRAFCHTPAHKHASIPLFEGIAPLARRKAGARAGAADQPPSAAMTSVDLREVRDARCAAIAGLGVEPGGKQLRGHVVG